MTAVSFGSTKNALVDLAFIEGNNRSAIAVFVNDDVYLLGETERSWTCHQKVKGFFNLDSFKLQSLQLARI
jgi:hypothetical protein